MSTRILLYRLPEDLSLDLRDALIASRIVPAIEEQPYVSEITWEKYDLIFCPASLVVLSAVLEAAAGKFPRVVAVSRLPEADEWIDALDLGAADYCAPPFEQPQLRWLIEKNLPSGKHVAA
jgi:DNA-binding response OmpR family regulator